jgi:hypothetical protein
MAQWLTEEQVTWLLSTPLPLAWIIVGFLVWRIGRTHYEESSRTSSSHATSPPTVRKSKYAALSSNDVAARTTAGNTEQAAPSAEEPPEASWNATLQHTQLKAMQLWAAAQHRLQQAASCSGEGYSKLEGPALLQAAQELLVRFPSYDASDPSLPSLQRFRHVREHTHCIFARRSKCFGSPAPQTVSSPPASSSRPSVEEQTLASVPGLVDFALRLKQAYPQQRPAAAKAVSPADASLLSNTEARSVLVAGAEAGAEAGSVGGSPLMPSSIPEASATAARRSSSSFALDAFVVEIDGAEHADTIHHFARTVRKVLLTLSSADPVCPARNAAELDSFGVDVCAAQSMAAALAADVACTAVYAAKAVSTASSGSHSSTPTAVAAAATAAAETAALRVIDTFSSTRWHFRFLGEPFFVTCFAPCYPSRGHARYMFTEEAEARVRRHEDEAGDNDADAATIACLREFKSKCYILLQPELSFLVRNLSADTPHTEWDAPRTERDRIRVAFRKAQRGYLIPWQVAYPSAYHIVPPLDPFSGDVVAWWQRTPADAAATQKASLQAAN